MTYHELVEELNKDQKALEYVASPIALYKDEKAMAAVVEKEQEETLSQVRKVVYPFWTICFIVNGLLLIGYYY